MVANEWNVRGFVKLLDFVRHHMKMLELLDVSFDEYGRSTLDGIQATLPWSVRVKWFEECRPQDKNIKSWINNLLDRVEREIAVLRECQTFDRSAGDRPMRASWSRNVHGRHGLGSRRQDENGHLSLNDGTGARFQPRSR